jgi:hypothetical protein
MVVSSGPSDAVNPHSESEYMRHCPGLAMAYVRCEYVARREFSK